MSVITNFKKAVKKFSQDNWWVYIIYAVLLCAILRIEKDKFAPVVFITTLHFIADVFIMMMFSAYACGKKQQGTYYQVVSMLVFMSLKIYTGVIDHAWHYLAADPLYICAAFKNYRIDVKKTSVRWVNYKSMAVLGLLIISGLLYLQYHGRLVFLSAPSQVIQTLGIFLFAIALSITGNEQARSELAVVALIAMVAGSAWETFNSLMNHHIIGLALSYFLLPLTVLVFYLKNWSGGMRKKKTFELEAGKPHLTLLK